MIRHCFGPIRFMCCMLGFMMVFYCLGISFLAYGFFYKKAEGSLIFKAHHVVGSRLLGQEFTQDKYFWPHPSLTHYENDVLLPNMIEEQKKGTGFSSASAVDADVMVDEAYAQVSRVAKARALPEELIQDCVDYYTQKAFLGIFGVTHVNVMALNVELDHLHGRCHD